MKDAFDRFQQPDRGRFGDNELASSSPTKDARSDLVNLDLILKNDRPRTKAIAVTRDGNSDDWIWLPRSQIEVEAKGLGSEGHRVRVTMPRWLAKEKGLI
jgi:hypothetical protein